MWTEKYVFFSPRGFHDICPLARACTTARRRGSRGSRFGPTRATSPPWNERSRRSRWIFAERCSAHTISTVSLGTSVERLLACCGLAQCACTLRPREPLFTPGVSAWAVLGGRCHDTVYSTTCGRIKKNAHPGASLLASLLPSLLILEEKEGEKQGWGAFPSTFFLFDHMWSNKRCHDT